MESIDEDGIIPDQELPKYSSDGQLLWLIKEIRNSRLLEDDIDGVQFEVHLGRTSRHVDIGNTSRLCPLNTTDAGWSWEGISAFNFGSYSDRNCLVNFYRTNPSKPGKPLTIQTWNAALAITDAKSEDYQPNLFALNTLRQIASRYYLSPEFEAVKGKIPL
jgi:hypothetical protein